MKYIFNLVRIAFFVLFAFLLFEGKMMLWLGLYAVSLLVALLFGRVYCGYICPMNTLMIPTEWLSKKLNLQKDTAPKWLSSGRFPWITLIGSIAIMLLALKMYNVNIPILLIWLVASVLITIRYKSAVFHNLICPFGPFQKIFGKFAKFSVRVNKDNCIGCKLCEKVCPSEAIIVSPLSKKADIDVSLCFQCTNCQAVCPKDTIHYSKKL